jgi:hypothetical protein
VNTINSIKKLELKNFLLVLVLFICLYGELKAMPGENCAFYGCPTSRKHGISLFNIPSTHADDSKETSDLKNNTRQAWLNLILRTRESTPGLKKSIQANNIHICEQHFKPVHSNMSVLFALCLRLVIFTLVTD